MEDSALQSHSLLFLVIDEDTNIHYNDDDNFTPFFFFHFKKKRSDISLWNIISLSAGLFESVIILCHVKLHIALLQCLIKGYDRKSYNCYFQSFQKWISDGKIE